MFGSPTIAESQNRFNELAGATLQWSRMRVAHHALLMTVAGATGGEGVLQFMYVRYVDCPVRMRSVRLRLAAEEEWRGVRPQLAPDDAAVVGHADCLVVDSAEGRAVIVANLMFVDWGERARAILAVEDWADEPLWSNGPPLSQL